MYCLLVLWFFLVSCVLHGEDALVVKEDAAASEAVIDGEDRALTPDQIAAISESFGHLIGKNIENIGVRLDMDKIIQGLKDAALGKEPPMSEPECVQAISQAQQVLLREQSATNLAKANDFLSKNANVPGVITIVDGKLQYKIDREGAGPSVSEHGAPVIRYVGTYPDGAVFVASKDDETIYTDEMIPGFAKGIEGMKEGEKRTIYIHPEMAYETNGYLMPNALLIFDVEVIKADAPEQEANRLHLSSGKLDSSQGDREESHSDLQQDIR
jgi:peptidylprolyl isomerase